MKKGLSEKKTLKKMNIPNFAAITEEKLPVLTELLPRMNPDVAKKALEQMPEFSKLSTHIVSTYKDLLIESYDETKDSAKAYFDSCSRILESLQQELDKKFLTPKRRDKIISQMIDVANMIDRKDTEIRHFTFKRDLSIGAILLAIPALFISVITFGRVKIKQ